MTLVHSSRTAPKILALAITGLVVASGMIAEPARAAASGTVYYVDATAGSDSSDGTSETTAWRSLDRINHTELQAGDTVLLRRGAVWTGEQLAPLGAGAEGDPIRIDAYGQGDKPRIETNGAFGDGLRLWNTSYWEVRNLDISNQTFVTDPTAYNAAGRAGDYRGIHIGGDDGQAHHHFVLDGVDVHDVTGEVKWIGERSGYTPPNGISFGNGWDRSKNTGGILITGGVADIANPGPTATTIHDIVIENSSVKNTSFGAITIKQYTGDAPGAVATGWGDRASASDPRFSPHTDIVIRDNYITQAGTAYGANGIYVTGSERVVVERNLVDRVGTCGIESYNTHDVVIQHNEVNYTSVKAGGQDSNAIDTDVASTDQIVQYNYAYGNGEGMLVYQQRFGDAIFRYNVIAASTKNSMHIASESTATGQIYNNTMIDTVGYVINGNSGKYTLRNNIFASSTGNAVSTGSSNLVYTGNLYSGVAPRPNETAAFNANPGFSAPLLTPPVSGTVRAANLDQALGLVPTAGARSVNAAAELADNGGHDYRGVALYQGAPDFGAFEYQTPAGQNTESIVGLVTSSASGAPVPGAVVTATGATGSATTGPDGWYVLGGVPFGSAVTVDVSRTGFANAHRTGVEVTSGTSTRADIALTATATTGVVSGKVVDANSQPIAAARVSLQNAAGTELAVGSTNSTGAFSFEAAAGTGYTLIVSAENYLSAVRTGINAEAALEAAVGTIILSGRDVHYEAIVDFESFVLGSATNVAPLAASQQNGTVTVGAEGENQFARISRTSGTGSTAPATSLTYTAATPLTGVVTVEQKVRRVSGQPSTQFFGAPYIRNSAGQNLISVGLSAGNISAYNGGTFLAQVATYTADQWIHVKVVIDTAAQTYSLYIDDRAVLQNARLRNTIGTGIAVVSNYSDGVNRGTLDVDDFRVAKGIGYGASETALGDLEVTPGSLKKIDPTRYELAVDQGTQTVSVAASALSPFAQGVTVNGVVAPTDGSGVPVSITGTEIPVVVTAEDGSSLTYTIAVRLPTGLADDATSVIAGESVTIDVLSNDGTSPTLRPETLTLLDAAGDPKNELGLEGGTFRVDDGRIVFAAESAASGPVAPVRYRVENTTGVTSTATISVTIRKPTALLADTAEVLAGESVTVDVLANDGTSPSLRPDTLTLLDSSGVAKSELALAGGTFRVEAGRIVFTAAANASGQVGPVDYRVENTSDLTSSAQIIVTVKPAPVTEPAWSASKAYAAGDRVSYKGRVFVAQWWTRNQAPDASPTGAWAEVGAVVACAAGDTRSWTNSWVYTGGEIVAHNGQRWRAAWWTRNQVPGLQYGPWLNLGSC